MNANDDRMTRVGLEVIRNMQGADGRGFPPPWKDDGSHPRDLGHYQPTGNATLDRILNNAHPRILYGGNNSGVALRRCDLDAAGYAKRGHSWIEQPNAEQFDSEPDRRATLCHELVHWTKEAGRVPRKVMGVTYAEADADKYPPGYAREELVAELGCAMLLDAIGDKPNISLRARYAANWAMELEVDELLPGLRYAMAEAEKAVSYLLQFAD